MTEVQMEAAIQQLTDLVQRNHAEIGTRLDRLTEKVDGNGEAIASLSQDIAIVKTNQAGMAAAITEVSTRISATEGRQFAFYMGVLGIFGTAFAGLLFKLLDFTKLP